MNEWLPFRDQFLARLIELEDPREKRKCADCGAEWSPWRCTECVGWPSLCTKCCCRRHEANYLHPIEKWVPEEAGEAGPEGTAQRLFQGRDGDDTDGEDEVGTIPQQGPIQSSDGMC